MQHSIHAQMPYKEQQIIRRKNRRYTDKDLTPPSSIRQAEIRNGTPNGRELSRISKFPGKKVNFQKLTEIFEMNFSKISVPFDSVPEFPEILVEWIAS